MKLVPFLLVILLAGCGKDEPRHVSASNPATVPVQASAALSQDWPELYEATGTVRARTAAVISAKVMGYVEQVSVKAGDRVRPGQPLISIDSRDLDTNVRRAEAARAEVQSAIPEADHAIAAAKANLDLAQTTFKRMEDLAAKKSISNQEFDEASTRLKAAQANYEMARARRSQIEPKLAQVEQEIRAATIMRGYATISAPFAGVVTAKSVETGNLAAPGTPLLTLEQEGAYRLEVSVDESRLPAVRAGQPVQVSLESLDRTLEARVSEVVPAVDASSRSYTVKIDLPVLAQVRSGMFGRAVFPIGMRKTVSVPQSALQERGQLVSVFVVEEGAARNRLITVGRRSGDRVEILSGLTEGERVITPVPASLVDGARVEVRP